MQRFTREQLAGKGHKELRALCRPAGASGSWIGSGTIEEYILYLTGEKTNSEIQCIYDIRKGAGGSNGNGSNGHSRAAAVTYPAGLDKFTRSSEVLEFEDSEETHVQTRHPGQSNNVQQAFESFISAIGDSVSEARVSEIIDERLDSVLDLIQETIKNQAPVVTTLKIESPAGVHEVKSRTHTDFDRLVKLIYTKYTAGDQTQSRYVLLVGPAGTGKTHICAQLAQAKGLKFYPISLGPDTSQFDLFGFRDAGGNYQETPLVKAFREGGLVLLDELDAASPESLLSINSMLSNGVVTLPSSEQIEKHQEFYLVAAANTYGRGQDRQYVGRSQLDGATLDRFYIHSFDYDETMEEEFVGAKLATIARKLRERAAKLGKNIIISSRALFDIAALVQLGDSLESAFESRVFKYDGAARELRTYLEEIK